MPTNDNRTQYIRESLDAASTLLVKQSFYDEFPLVKTQGDEQTDAVYYTEADGLTHIEALSLKFPERVACMQEVDGEAPVNLGSIADNDGAYPEGTTHIFYAFPKVMSAKMLIDLIAQIQEISDQIVAQGGDPINPNQFIIRDPKGSGKTEKDIYLKTGKLPT